MNTVTIERAALNVFAQENWPAKGAAQRPPILLLTQHGYFAAAAFLIVMAAYGASAPSAAEE
jgi:hypothetical protein